ncbi:UNVERIFIED_ORG: hypothetical protein E4P37_09050 [Bacillus sp. AZ43]
MAGGMNRHGSRPSLGERAADSGVPAADPAGRPAGVRAAPGDGGEGRHCWVRDPPDRPGTWPGLLVEWRQRAGGWQGRVAYTVTGPHGPALVEAWLPAARLEPR